MIYKRAFFILSNIFDLESKLEKAYRPEGVKKWGFSDYADMVYEVYVTNYNGKSKSGSFGFWVHDEDEDTAYKLAIKRVIKCLVWTYKVRFSKWLK